MNLYCSVVSILSTVLALGQAPTKEELRAALKQSRDGLGAFSYKLDMAPMDRSWSPLVGEPIHRSEYAEAPDGRFYSRDWFESGGVRSMDFSVCDDGRRRYRVLDKRDQPGTIEKLIIDNISTTPSQRYVFTSNNFAWIFRPQGRPLHEYVDADATLEADPGGGEKIVLTIKIKARVLHYTLDPARDWLPTHVRHEGAFDIEVLRFKHINGRWFPVEGRFIVNPAYKDARNTIIVDDVHINSDIPDSRFSRPAVPPGTLVIDDAARKYGRLVGASPSVNTRPVSASAPPKVAGPKAPQMLASPHESSSIWPWVTRVSGGALIVALLLLAWNGLRRTR